MVMLFISAILVSAAFEPVGAWIFSVIGYALFFRSLRKSRNPIISSFIFGLVVNGIVLHWSGKYVGALPWIFLSLLQASFYIPVGWLYQKSKSFLWTIFGLLAMEELRSRFPFGGFGWTRIAFSQVDSPLLPLVAFGGVLLLSFATLLLALLLTTPKVKSLAIALICLLLVCFVDFSSPTGRHISVAAVQGNTPTVGLEFNGRAKAVFNLHLETTRALIKEKFDLIVWPENAIDIDPRLYPQVQMQIAELVSDLDTPLIAGVVLTESGSPANASILYRPVSGAESTYIKRHLTPFGEFMPLRKLAELTSPYAKQVVDFLPGDSFVAHSVAGNKLGPIICYEIIDDGLVRQAALNSGALIVQTNSATFADTAESAQQLAITRIRAVEHAREILSVSTIGISAFIDNNGEVRSQTKENVAALLTGDLQISDSKTLADKLGGAAPLTTLLISLVFALVLKKNEQSQ